jgi:uncharacterized protein YeaO (DUF488 family)
MLLYPRSEEWVAVKMIKTKSVFEPRSHDDGVRLLITRFHPRGITNEYYDAWIRQLAPSAKLLMRYKNGKLEWNEFVRVFMREMLTHSASRQMLRFLKASASRMTVTLLCYEKDGNCHRHVVKDLIESDSIPRIVTH